MRRRSAVGAGWESVHIQRSLRWMSRSDGNWGPRFCSTAPAQHPPLLLHQISPWAGRSGEDESRAEVRCVRRNFSNRVHTQVRTVRKRGTERTALAFQRSAQGGNRYNVQRNAAAFGGRRRVGIGTYTTLAPLDEPKRWQLGPTILFDRPRPAPPTPPPSDFPVGWPAALWRRGQARRTMRAMVRRNFSNRAHRQSADGEEAGGRRELRWRSSGRRRWESVQRTTECGGVRRSAQGGNRYIYNARSAG